MPQYDGSIRINTEIDTKNASSQMIGLANQIQKTSDKIASLRSKMNALRDVQIPTQAYKDIETDIAKAEVELQKLIEKQSQMQIEGKDSGAAWDRLNQKIQAAKDYIDYAKTELQELVDTGKAFTLGSDTEQFENLGRQLQYEENHLMQLNARWSEYTARQSSVSEKFSQMRVSAQKAFDAIRSGLSKIGSIGKKAFSGIFSMAKKAFSAITSGSKQSNASLSGGLKTILKYGLGIRSLYALFSKIRSGIQQGFKNLMDYSGDFAISIQSVKNSMSTLGNQIAAAFAPIVQMVIPWLNQLISALSTAMSYVAQFIAILGGKSTFTRAKQVQDSYNKSLGGTAAAAKKAYGALAKFDDLDVLQKQEDTSGGGAGEAIGDMFEEVPIDSKILDILKWLKEMWENSDFYELGKLLGEKLKEALDNIPWEEIKETVRKIGKSLASLINGFIEVEGLGYSIGKTLVEAMNTGFEFLNAFVHELHWESIGHFIADTLNGFFENIDWKLIKDTFITGFKGLADAINQFIVDFHWDNISDSISNLVNIIAETIYTFFSETNFDELGQKLGEQLRKSIEKIDWEKVGMALGSIVQAALDFLISFVKEQDLSEVAKAIMDTLKGFFKTVDAGDLADVILTAIAAKLALKATQFAFTNAAKSILSGLGSSISASVAATGSIAAAGATIGTVLIGGIAGVLMGAGLGELLDNYILAPLMSFDEELSEQYKNFKWFGEDGFFAQFKSSLTDGSWKGALELWGQDIKAVFEAIGEKNFTVSKEAGQNIIKGLNEGLADPTASVSNKMGELCNNAISSAKETLGIHSPSTVFLEIGENIMLGLISGINSILDSVNEIWQTMKNYAVSAWTEIKEKAITIFTSIKDNITNKFNEIKTNFETFKTNVSTIWTNLWDGFKTKVGDIVTSVKETLTGFFDWVQGIISSILSSISSIGAKISGISGGIGGSLGGSISGGIPATATYSTQSFASLTADLPHLASGSVIRGGNPFMAILGDQRVGQTNIEAPAGLIKDMARQGIREELSALNLGGGQARLVLNINGADVGEAILDDLFSVMQRRGYDVDVLGVT